MTAAKPIRTRGLSGSAEALVDFMAREPVRRAEICDLVANGAFLRFQAFDLGFTGSARDLIY